MVINEQHYLLADWPDKPGKPENICAITTLRQGGASLEGYSEFNLASHVGDDPAAVMKNRAKLHDDLQLFAEPFWLEQVHSNKVIYADASVNNKLVEADASFSREKGVVCAVLTADCLPVFFCNNSGTEVAVAHAGWRGLLAGILSNTLHAMSSAVDDIQVSLGPAIGANMFEVGAEVWQTFVKKNAANEMAFVATTNQRYLCDIYQLARIELQAAGISHIAGGGLCTYIENDRFYSYRRQSASGRMASLIWLR